MSEEYTSEHPDGGDGVATVDGAVSQHPGMSQPPPGMEQPMSQPPPGASNPPMASQPPPSAPPPEPEPEPQPAKKKKRKIDLKSRLSSVRAARGSRPASDAGRKSDPLSFPPPPTAGGVPAPKIALPGPAIASPFAEPEPEKKPTAVQQTIKVEMGEEIVQERKKASKRTALIVVLAFIVAFAFGFIIGGVRTSGQAQNKAIAGAKALAGDIDEANKSMSTLSDALRDATEKLGQDEFPNDLEEVLKSTNVPFSAANFEGKSVGSLPAETFNQLLAYTSEVEKLNQQKDALRNLLSVAKPQVEAFIAEKSDPKIKFSVLVAKADKEFVVELVPNKEPFEEKKDWPETYTVQQPGEKGKVKDTEVIRYTDKVKLTGNDKPTAIPVDRNSVAGFTDLTLIFKLRKAMSDTKSLIDGVESPLPDQQKDGLLKDGNQLIESLNKVAQAG